MLRISIAVLALLVAADVAIAAHANPWATPEDDVLGKNHDENLEQSVDTPGEHEWNGKTNRAAPGRLDPSVSMNGHRNGEDGDGHAQ